MPKYSVLSTDYNALDAKGKSNIRQTFLFWVPRFPLPTANTFSKSDFDVEPHPPAQLQQTSLFDSHIEKRLCSPTAIMADTEYVRFWILSRA